MAVAKMAARLGLLFFLKAECYAATKLICLLLFRRCSLNAAVIERRVSRVLVPVRDECRMMDSEGIAGSLSIWLTSRMSGVANRQGNAASASPTPVSACTLCLASFLISGGRIYARLSPAALSSWIRLCRSDRPR